MASKEQRTELDELGELDHRFRWDGVDAETLRAALTWAVAQGLAVRFSPVGYGTALRFTLSDTDASVFGVTLGSGTELDLLCRGLLRPGAEEYVKRHSEPMRGRRRR